MNDIDVYDVNPAYSSYIGNLQHQYFDPVNAAMEIARRGKEIILNKNKAGFYPPIQVKDTVQHQWKEMGTEFLDLTCWKDIFNLVKNSKMRYRVSLKESLPYSVFRNKSTKSKIKFYDFI